MSITIADILKLDEFREAKVITGKDFLDVEVKRVTVIETPLISAMSTGIKYGQRGDLNISALFAYKENVEEMLAIIQTLIHENASGLCVVDAYIKQFPDEVIRLANSSNFPIIHISYKIPYANLISRIMEMIIKDQEDIVSEQRIKNLLEPNITKNRVREICQNINKNFKEYNCVVLISFDDDDKNNSQLLFWDLLKNKRNYSMLKYGDSLLLILTFERGNEESIYDKIDLIISRIMEYTSVSRVGFSSLMKNLDLLPKAIKEAQLALYKALNFNQDVVSYRRMGIYQLLVPLRKNEIVISFVESIVRLLKEKDGGKKRIFETAQQYVLCNCNSIETARVMDVHENTVRYRLEKIRELINDEMTLNELDEILSITMKLYELNQK